MTNCSQHIIGITQTCCKYKAFYIFIVLISASVMLFYIDKSFTLVPIYLSNTFHGTSTEKQYLSIFDEIVWTNKTKKKILVWTTFFKNMHWEKEIREKLLSCKTSCEVTSDRAQFKSVDALLFHHGDLVRSDLPPSRLKHQPWILFTLEPTSLIQGNMNWWGRIFNWTMSYRTYSTIFNPYGFYLNETRLKSFKELAVSYKTRTKDMFAVISRCHDDARRYKIIDELNNHFKVDVYGRCSPNKLKCDAQSGFYCIPSKEIEKYKFRLAFENGNCRDYITEKYWTSLLQNIVPIVNWKTHKNNYNVVPKSYINIYDFESVQSAIKFIKQVSDNETLYNSYYDWKLKHTAKSSMYSGFCRLCDKLHQPFNAQVYRDLEKWFRDDTCNKYNLFDGAFRHVDRLLFDLRHN